MIESRRVCKRQLKCVSYFMRVRIKAIFFQNFIKNIFQNIINTFFFQEDRLNTNKKRSKNQHAPLLGHPQLLLFVYIKVI